VMQCPEVRSKLAAYVAGALDPKEHDEIEAHIAECAGCARALSALRSVEELAAGAPLRPEAPAELEERVFAYVQSYEAAQAASLAALGPEPPTDLERRSLERAGILGRPRSLRHRVATVLAPAFAAAAAVLSFMYMDARSDLDTSPGVAISPTASSVIGGSAVEVPQGHPMQTIQLTGGVAAADLELVHFKHDNYRLELRTVDLPGCPPGHYYELWMRGDDGEVSAGSFRIIRPDDILFSFNVGIDPGEYHLVEITREPEHGGPHKEGPVVMRGELDLASIERD
jgi:hypothetical protein